MIDIDLREQQLSKLGLLKYLLYNQSIGNGSYILWGTDDYDGHTPEDEILPEHIVGDNRVDIKPRVIKEKEEQKNRTKGKAEVFTPCWMCKTQNDLVDETMKDLDWQDYVKANVIEITCGEAPYLVSRYDTTTGEYIEIKDRIGLLDRKLAKINENVTNEDEWLKWTKEAFKHTYGYEWQGDSLLLARENLYATFVEYFQDKFNKEPGINDCVEICEIISWNIFQMDGLTFNLPLTDTPAKTMDWDEKKVIEYKNISSQEKPEPKKKQVKKKLEPVTEEPVEQPFKSKRKKKKVPDPCQLLLFDESFFE